MIKIDKKFLIIAAVSLLVIILLFLVVLTVVYQKKVKQQKDNVINSTTTPATAYFKKLVFPTDKPQLQNKELANKVNNWLNSMKNSSDDQILLWLILQ